MARAINERLRKQLPPSEALKAVRMRDGSQMLLDLRSNTEWPAYYSGVYESMLPGIIELLKEPCMALDVGANIGFWTVPLGRHMRKLGGRVAAFEPVPTNYDRLKENLRRNDLSETVQTFPVALGEENRTITILRDDCHGATTGNAARVVDANLNDGQVERCPLTASMVRLDDMADQLHMDGLPCRFIKVDIEGSEPFFFRGAARFLATHQPIILAEVNPPWLKRNGLSWCDYLTAFGPARYRALAWQSKRWKRLNGDEHSGEPPAASTVMFVPNEMRGICAA
jgi:FkbM family methyltransferase